MKRVTKIVETTQIFCFIVPTMAAVWFGDSVCRSPLSSFIFFLLHSLSRGRELYHPFFFFYFYLFIIFFFFFFDRIVTVSTFDSQIVALWLPIAIYRSFPFFFKRVGVFPLIPVHARDIWRSFSVSREPMLCAQIVQYWILFIKIINYCR